ncbi:hypothetical protein BJX64DRAFT_174724 [Aspergillus heterothallicus]
MAHRQPFCRSQPVRRRNNQITYFTPLSFLRQPSGIGICSHHSQAYTIRSNRLLYKIAWAQHRSDRSILSAPSAPWLGFLFGAFPVRLLLSLPFYFHFALLPGASRPPFVSASYSCLISSMHWTGNLVMWPQRPCFIYRLGLGIAPNQYLDTARIESGMVVVYWPLTTLLFSPTNSSVSCWIFSGLTWSKSLRNACVGVSSIFCRTDACINAPS